MIVTVKIAWIFLLQVMTGYGVNQKLGFRARPAQVIGLAMLTGLGITSLVVFALEVARIPLGFTSITIAMLIVACFFWKVYFKLRSSVAGWSKWPKFYEYLFLVPITILVATSIWRCVYQPITPFDSKVGIDLVAKYALMEGTIASTVFTEHIPGVWYSSNQPFYAPFAMLMQVVFRSTGLPFGKVWLSFLFVGFLFFFYNRLRSSVHPIIAGVLLLVFLCIPEMYAYTFLVQTDFSNAVFFALGVIFFYDYFIKRDFDKTKLMLSIMFISFAVWARSETIVIVPLGLSLILYKEFPIQPKRALIYSMAYLAIPLAIFVMWNFVYIKLYLPVSPAALSEINLSFDSYLPKIWTTVKGMVKIGMTPDYWNYAISGSVVLYLLNLIIFRSFKGSHPMLWILVFFVLFVFMIYHIPGVGIGTTYRRGLFKFLPLLIFVLSQIPLVTWLSDKITTWENR